MQLLFLIASIRTTLGTAEIKKFDSRPVMDVALRLDELMASHSCVYEAIEPILVSCEAPENITERTWLSVSLSVCEFSAASVEFPLVCVDPSQLTKCTQLLETKATWWTTFSGNYRHISVVCQEYRPQFEAKKIVKVIRNAADIVQSYESQQRESLSATVTAMSVLNTQWTEAANRLTGWLSSLEDQAVKTDLTLENNALELAKLVDNVTSVLRYTATELSNSIDASRKVHEETVQLRAEFSEFEDAMNAIQVQQLMTANMLQESTQQTKEVLESANQTLKSSKYAIESLIGIFHFALSITWKLWCCVLVLWLARRACKKVVEKVYSTARPASISDIDSDPIFL